MRPTSDPPFGSVWLTCRFRGRPETILEAWARHARAAGSAGSVDVSRSALLSGKLHFLLDGLDEVANGLQAVAASLIADVAARFPQHAFTVTSRPLPALSVLGVGEAATATPWRILE